MIQYSTYFTDKNNKPRTDIGGKTVTFSLFISETGGSSLWSEDHTISSSNGFISVMLGMNNSLPLAVIDTASVLWLEMKLAEETAFNRQLISTNFYSISAQFADTARFAAFSTSTDTAYFALLSRHANRADSLGDKSINEYALISDLPVKVDSSIISIRSDSSKFAVLAGPARNSDSLNGKPAGEYLLTSNMPTKVDSSNVAKNADSLGSIAAAKYLKETGDSNNVTICGYTCLGDGAPNIKIKRITGYNMPQTEGTYLHIELNLFALKILAVWVYVYDGSSLYPQNYTLSSG
jgi:hypothetical protein